MNNFFAETRSGSEEGSYLRRTDCVSLKFRLESNKEEEEGAPTSPWSAFSSAETLSSEETGHPERGGETMGRQEPIAGKRFSPEGRSLSAETGGREEPVISIHHFVVTRNCITSRNAGKTGMGGGRREARG